MPWEGAVLVLSQRFFYLLYWEWQKMLKVLITLWIFYDPYVRILTVFCSALAASSATSVTVSQKDGSAFPDHVNHCSIN